MEAYGDFDYWPLVDAAIDNSIAGPVHLCVCLLEIDAHVQLAVDHLGAVAMILEFDRCLVHNFFGQAVESYDRSDVEVIIPLVEISGDRRLEAQ